MEKIALIEQHEGLSSFGLYCRHSFLDPIALEYLGAMVNSRNIEVKIMQRRTTSLDIILKEIAQFNPKYVAFSSMTYNIKISKRLSKKIKYCMPNTITIFGGYHPSSCPEIVEDENIDFVIIGEGERTLVDILATLNLNDDITKVKGIAFWDAGLRINTPRERIRNLDKLPFPLRDREIIRECKIGGLSYPPVSKQKSVCQITYSRGCPYNCLFCSSPHLWGSEVRWRSAKNLVDEIEYLQREFGTNMIFFTDLTFNLNRMKINELCNEMRTRMIDINWFSMCRANHEDKDFLIAMKEAGCTKISYGIDSLNEKSLEKIKPRQNINLKKIKSTLELTNDVGIIVRAYIIIGYPWESKESLQETETILKSLPIDDIRISFLTPFPGTNLFEEFKKENLLLTEDFSQYTSEKPIVKTENLSTQELTDARDRIFKKFYQSKEYEARWKKKINKFSYLKQSYNEFFEFLYENSILL